MAYPPKKKFKDPFGENWIFGAGNVPAKQERPDYNGPLEPKDPLKPIGRANPAKLRPIAGSSTMKVGAVNLPKGVTDMGLKAPNTTMAKVAAGVKSFAPFASNFVNAFRRAPKPVMGAIDSHVSLQKVNLDNERSQVESGIRGANMAIDRNVDGNTAEIVHQSNLATRFNQLSSVNAQERNENSNISNRQTMINSQIDQSNNRKVDDYNQEQVQRSIAEQRASSENIANFSDKVVGIDNENGKRDLEGKKFGWLMATDTDGTVARQMKKMQDAGEDDPVNTKYATGGAFTSKRMRKVFN